MEEKTVAVVKKTIGNTTYVVEYAVSASAKETAYDKVKRLVLDSVQTDIKKTA